MSSDRRPVRAAILATGLAGVLAFATLGGAATEEDLFRQVKVDVFDQDWPAVLSGCDEILRQKPSGQAAARASFYRARALSKIPGREAEGLDAFRKFVAAYPREKVMVEEAWGGIFTAACHPRAASRAACGAALREGLADSSSYVSTLAAIRAADSGDEALRPRALATLKKAYATQTEPEIKNEILIAILKIDPSQVPQVAAPAPPPAPRSPGDKSPPAKEPTLIRMSVYNKIEKRYELKVNLPVAFARMLVDALDEADLEDISREAEKKGI
ncbi:MAG TPA: hypothetical protein VN898_12695, partial [Candidatus Binatia bacterium]|nr:hypothetical protein [Candidatus Binatia bacterium]